MDDANFPMHTSEPSVPRSNGKKNFSTYSSVTHPSMDSSRKDHLNTLFEKIKKGDNVLSRIPLRLDPNIEFSDDEDEEPAETVIKKPAAEASKAQCDIPGGKENQKKFLAEVMKTPEFPRVSHSSMNNMFLTQEKKRLDIAKNRHEVLRTSFSSSKASFLRPILNPLGIQRGPLDLFPKPNGNILGTVASKQKSSDLLNIDVYDSVNPIKSDSDNSIKSDSALSVKSDSALSVKSDSALPNETIEVNNKVYNVLSLLGSGGSCKVYSVYDIQDKTRVAIKRVNLKDTDPSIRKGFEQEIEYLQKMQTSNRVIKMYDFEYRENELLLVLEHGDIDFARYLFNESKLKRLKPLMIKFYWAQMLEAVADIHKYGIVHSDLKPANFLLVAGNLKLIDFGIATSVPEDKTSTFRDTQVGTLNYMSPEAITQMSADSKQRFKIGVKSDVWSLGCILYNLVYGTTPFHSFKNLSLKIHAITNPDYEIPLKPLSDPLLLDVLQLCLKRNPKERASVEELLNHPYLAEENTASASAASMNPNPALETVLQRMKDLTPRRMSYVSKVVQELSEKSDA